MEHEKNEDPTTDTAKLSLRAHDIAVCLEKSSAPDLENIQMLGWAVRLALHLRGVPAQEYLVIRDVCIHVLDIPMAAVREVVLLLAEAEFVSVVMESKTIKAVVPDVPYYQRLYEDLGDLVLRERGLSEPEQLCSTLLDRLSSSPLLEEHAYALGADRQLVKRVVDIGSEGRFINSRVARGRTILISPAYFPDNPVAYADLVAAEGAGRVKRVLELLQDNPGWPLRLIKDQHELGGASLTKEEVQVAEMLGAEGFSPVPAITTAHQGTNYFLFGPRPGAPRLPSFKKQVYEKAMALIAAVRQGQLLPHQYAIHFPLALLRKLREAKSIKSTTEAYHQYKGLCTMGVGRLEKTGANWYRFEIIDLEENMEALDLAITIFEGGEAPAAVNEEVVLALRAGQRQLESLLGRKRLLSETVIAPDQETLESIDEYLLRAGS